jgi:hypothetical protein
MGSFPQSKQLDHSVVHGGQVPPKVDEAVFPRGYLLLKLLRTDAGKEFTGSFQIAAPRAQRGRNYHFFV